MESKHPRALLLALVLSPLAVAAQPDSPARAHEPVVLEGHRLPALLGHDPDRIAAFRYDSGWEQVPVQVDERRTYHIALAFRYGDFHPDGYCDPQCQEIFEVAEMTYWTDAETWVGADSTDLTFDEDDEVAFMARDAAGRRVGGAPDPAGAVAGTRVEVQLTAPEGGAPTYAYLFAWEGPPPDAGSYVSYEPVYCDKRMETPSDPCNPISPDVPYIEHYDVYGDGPGLAGRYIGYRLGSNPEDTWVEGSSYRIHFSDRWILDSLSLGPDGPDLIDREKVNGYDLCNRHERAASHARGAHIVNKSGPIRTLRAVLGYTSGPLTQREHVFYDQYIEEYTYLRLHPLDGGGGRVMYYDFDEAARGMVYYSNLVPAGVVMDSNPDDVPGGPIEWDIVRGTLGSNPGTLVSRYEYVNEELLGNPNLAIPFHQTQYYEDTDDEGDHIMQCTGDLHPFGAHGMYFVGDDDRRTPNSDPRPYRIRQHGELYRTEFGLRTVLKETNLSDPETDELLDALDAPLTATVDPGVFVGSEPRAADAATRLLAPHPNPAHGDLTVPFRLAAAGPVRLALHDVLGRAVALLHDGPLPAGAHRVEAPTAGLPAGVYLLRLTTPEGAQARTVMLTGGPRP